MWHRYEYKYENTQIPLQSEWSHTPGLDFHFRYVMVVMVVVVVVIMYAGRWRWTNRVNKSHIKFTQIAIALSLSLDRLSAFCKIDYIVFEQERQRRTSPEERWEQRRKNKIPVIPNFISCGKFRSTIPTIHIIWYLAHTPPAPCLSRLACSICSWLNHVRLEQSR